MKARININHPSVARHRYKEHMRTVGRGIDDILENLEVHPDDWATIDAARIRAGGSWSDVKTIRVRQADNVMNDKEFTVIELTVRAGHITGVRILQVGIYPHVLQRGPFLLWELEPFMLWFLDEAQPVPGVELYKQVWIKNGWAKAQSSIAEISEVFTT